MSALPESERISTVPFWINDRRVTPERGGRMADVTNPATGAVTRRVALASKEDVDVAVRAAAAASVLLAELFAQAGLPKGVFNVIHGDREAVDALLEHPQVAAVSFVGSTPVANHVYETGARFGKRVQALGGAKNHAVVLPDADMEFTADAIAGAAYGSAGERCMAISVVVAVGDAADPLLELLAKRARSIAVGPGDAASIDMGPLVSAAHRDRVSGFIDRGIAEGAKRRPWPADTGTREGIFPRPGSLRQCRAADVDLS